MKSIRDSKQLYWGLIITFFVLYFCVGFVSTLHSITFFELANTMWMAVLLGITYEVGQASVLFSILMTKNSQKMLPWLLMFLLTALQVTANVYASFLFMDTSGSNVWTFWQRSILFWMETDSPEMFKVVISWITGALLPIVALGMTALVAENLKLKDEENKEEFDDPGPGPDDLPPTEEKTFTIPVNEISEEEAREKLRDLKDTYKEEIEIPEEPFKDQETYEKLRTKNVPDKIKESIKEAMEKDVSEHPDVIKEKLEQERLQNFADDLLKNQTKIDTEVSPLKTEIETTPMKYDIDNPAAINQGELLKKPFVSEPIAEDGTPVSKSNIEPVDPNVGISTELDSETGKISQTGLFPKKPLNNKRGWHLQKEFTDTNGDVYHFGQYQPPKKAKG